MQSTKSIASRAGDDLANEEEIEPVGEAVSQEGVSTPPPDTTA